jgi:WD40 repeat protein
VEPPSFPRQDSTLYFGRRGPSEIELQIAKPENGPAQTLTRIPVSRIPFDSYLWQAVVSPDGKWLAAPLLSRGTTDIWGIPTNGDAMRQLSAFGPRSTLITRRVSWSPDSKYIYVALGEADADIVLLDGLLPSLP